MPLPLKEFSATGVAIIDEVVRCNEAVAVGGEIYYKGYLAHTCNGNIEGADSATYGVWTLPAKAGDRKTVLIAGYPASAAEVAVDLKNGWVWAYASTTYYVRYLAHDPIKHNINNLLVPVPYTLTASTSIVIAQIKFPFFAKIGYALIDVQGVLPSAAATIMINNGTEGVALTVSNTATPNLIELSALLKITQAETLTLSTLDGKGASGLNIWLMDV